MNILLSGTVGSTAYNLATEESDIDTLGVYIAPIRDVLGLSGPDAVKNTVTTTKPDSTFHEIGKFMGLALKANPTILEMFYLPKYDVITSDGRILKEARKLVLSEGYVRNAYGGYAYDQARKLANRSKEGKDGFGDVPFNRVKKHGRHVGRLLYMGSQLLTQGTMSLDCSDVRQDLFDLGELAAESPERFEAEFRKRLDKFNALKSRLPEKPNRELVNELLIDIRLNAEAFS